MFVLDLIKLHNDSCPFRDEGRHYFKCKCSFWVDNGKAGKGRIRKSLKTSVRTRADEERAKIELGLQPASDNVVGIGQVCERFLAQRESEDLEPTTVRRLRSALIGNDNPKIKPRSRTAPSLAEWAVKNGVVSLMAFGVHELDAYRATWHGTPSTTALRIRTMRLFFAWCVERGYCTVNPAQYLKTKKKKVKKAILRDAEAEAQDEMPTKPYSREEFQALLDGCVAPVPNETRVGEMKRRRLRTLLLLMRYTGLRVSDAIRFTWKRLEGNLLKLRQHKNGQWVTVMLPEWLPGIIEATPACSSHHFFIEKNQTPHRAYASWMRKLVRVAKQAEVSDPGFHRLRDTFAVELLSTGVSVEHVSMLLGHSSVTITERHYAHWVPARQVLLHDAVRRALAQDPIAQREQLMQLQVAAERQ